MLPLGRRWAYVGLNGFILAYYSEWMFYIGSPHEVSFGDAIVTWFAYSLVTYCCFMLIKYYHVRTLAKLFLVGAIYGWLLEGVFVQTMYANFPLYLSWTGLAWHALFVIIIAWYGLHRQILRGRMWQATLACAGIGLFFGIMANGWGYDGEIATTGYTIIYGLGFTVLLIIATVALHYLGEVDLTPHRYERYGLSVLVLLFTIMTCLAVPFAAVVLPLVLGLTLFLIRHRHDRSTIAYASAMPIAPANALLLFLMPLIAVGLYWLGKTASFPFEGFALVGITLIPAGFIAYAISAVTVLYSRST